MPKASVLPEPVLALPQMSWPARASVMVRAWMANGSSMPSAREGRGEVGGDAERLESWCGHELCFRRREDITKGGDAWVTPSRRPDPCSTSVRESGAFRG